MSSEINRKIAVIFVVDVVGYSRHMEVNENGTVHMVKTFVHAGWIQSPEFNLK